MDAAPTAPHGPIWQGASVLVVDDEPSMRQILRRTLQAENFHVEEAPDGESALRLIQARPEGFDLVLTDLSMPVIDGRQVSEIVARYRPSVATDLAAVAETEIVRAHAALSNLALALEASRTTRVQTIDLVMAARELRWALEGHADGAWCPRLPTATWGSC